MLSSTTLTCTAAAIEAGANSGNTNPRTCGDTDADGSPNDFDCTSSPNSLNANPAGVTCAGDPCTATECCTVEPVAAPRTCIDFDCTSSPNSLNANPAGVTCAGDPCTATECCAVEPVADVVTEDDFSNVTFTLSGHQESCTKHCGDLGKQCVNENYGSEFADVSTYTEGGIYPSECTSFRSHSPNR